MGQIVVPLLIEVTSGILEQFLFNQSIESYGVDSLHLSVHWSLSCQQVLSLCWYGCNGHKKRKNCYLKILNCYHLGFGFVAKCELSVAKV